MGFKLHYEWQPEREPICWNCRVTKNVSYSEVDAFSLPPIPVAARDAPFIFQIRFTENVP